jgi:hypothetical protein
MFDSRLTTGQDKLLLQFRVSQLNFCSVLAGLFHAILAGNEQTKIPNDLLQSEVAKVPLE